MATHLNDIYAASSGTQIANLNAFLKALMARGQELPQGFTMHPDIFFNGMQNAFQTL